MQKNITSDIQKDCVICAITSMLNVSLKDTITLMRNLDNRVLNGTTSLLDDCSFQVANSYQMYRKYVELIDPLQHKKRVSHFKTVL